jgi:hypothetical protein
VTGPVDGSLLADGSVVSGKLDRGSVLPENYGRGNSIRSFTGTTQNPYTVLYVVPAGKTFIVTDIIAFRTDISASLVVAYLGAIGNSTQGLIPRAAIATQIIQGNGQPSVISFQAGIRFDSGEMIGIGIAAIHQNAYPAYMTVSGYEF